MKKYDSKKQAGAISVFVMMAMLFFLFTIIGVYAIGSKRAQTQTESLKIAKEKFYSENAMDTYEKKMALSNETIPIYTKEQLWTVGSDKKVEIEGKVYTFSAGAKYELKNDIIMNIETDLKNAIFKENDNKIVKNNFKMLYYYQDNYYRVVDYSGTKVAEDKPVLSASGENFGDISERLSGFSGNYYLFALEDPTVVTFDYNYLNDNLWLNGNDPSKYYGNSVDIVSRNTVEDASALNGKVLEFSLNSTRQSGGTGVWVSGTKLTAGKQYTFSVYVKATSNRSMSIGQEQGGYKSVNVTTQWQRVTHTFTANNNSFSAFIFYSNSEVWASESDKLYIHSLELTEGNSLNIRSYDMACDSTLEKVIDTPTRDGYTFEGWFTEPVGGELITSQTKVTKQNVTYYAHWKKAKVPVYGSSLLSNYEKLYASFDPQNPMERKTGSNYHDTYYVGNCDCAWTFWQTRVNSNHRVITSGTLNDYLTPVVTGSNNNTFLETVRDNWIGIWFRAGGATVGVNLSNFHLTFSDNTSLTVNEAISSGYIEPLVLYSSGASNSSAYLWQNVGNIITGGQTDTRNYPQAVMMLKVRDKAFLKGVSFDTNKAWTTPNDGFVARLLSDVEFSTEPF